MKRILCIIESLGSGGAERQLTGLAVMLKQKGYIVEVCYYVKNDFYLPFLKENEVGSYFLAEASNPQRRFVAIKKYLKEFKPDTVISYSASPSIILGLFKKFGESYNLIVSERSTTQIVEWRDKLRFFFYKWADVIVPNSHSQASFIEKNYPRLAKKINVITNFVDTVKFSPDSNKNESKDVAEIICVGRLVSAKNIPLFIEAVSRVVADGINIHVSWYGQDLHDEYSKKCHAALSKYKMEKYFVFLAPSINIQEEYKKADVFCLSSIYEGFPNVLCEAMSCGLPVICSNVSDVPLMVKEGENGFLFDPNDIDSIVGSLEKITNQKSEAIKKMGNRSRELALGMFSKDSFVQKYIEIL